MSESLKAAVEVAVLRILEPLVGWLLEAGVGVGDLQPLVKTAYVRAARNRARDSGAEYTKPNASRISIVTGLTRREVASILEADAARPTHDRGKQRAERVLSGWWNDLSFQDESGQPATLPVRGAKRSFAALVERYSGEGAQVATILAELLRVKAVRRLADGRVQALSRTYATMRWDPDGVRAFGEQVSELCASLLQNLKSPRQVRFVRRVLNSRLDPRYLPLLVRDLEQQAEVFADAVDDTLNDPLHTLKGVNADRDAASLGVAVYTFESVRGVDAEPKPGRDVRMVAAHNRVRRVSRSRKKRVVR
jgi:Family of unknown function (DUF6502)